MSNPFEEENETESNFTHKKKMSSSQPQARFETKHVFQIHNYKIPTFCAHCNSMLVGVIRQGLRCKRCETDVHERCQEDIQKPCIEVIIGQHNFREKTYKQLTYCDYCEKLLVGVVNQGLKCTECGTNVHEKCQERVQVVCEKSSRRTSKQKQLKPNQESPSRGFQRTVGSRRTVRSPRKADEKTPLKSMDELNEKSEGTGETSYVFETMPVSSKTKNALSPSSLPGSPSRTPRQQRSHSFATTGALDRQVGEVMEVMQDNARKLEQRGDKLEDLQDNAERLEENANVFKKKAEKIKSHYWLKNQKLKIGIGIALLLLVIVIIIIIVVKTQTSKSTNKG